MKSIKRQLETATEDLSEASRAKELAVRENKHLQEDLTVMTSENQVIFVISKQLFHYKISFYGLYMVH